MTPSDNVAIETRLRRPRRLSLQHELNAATPSPCGDRNATSCSMAETPAARLLRYARYSAPPHAHLRDGRTLIAAKELCAALGSLSSISAWVHHLLPALATTPGGTAGALRAPALWLLDQLIRGAGGGAVAQGGARGRACR